MVGRWGGGVSGKKITSCYTFKVLIVSWRKHKNYKIISVPVSIKLLVTFSTPKT